MCNFCCTFALETKSFIRDCQSQIHQEKMMTEYEKMLHNMPYDYTDKEVQANILRAYYAMRDLNQCGYIVVSKPSSLMPILR